MHIEKNVFENIFNTVMDFKATTKDTVKARQDLANICKRSALELKQVNGKIVKPPAAYVLTKENKKKVLEWMKGLKLPDGYSSNIGNCVNVVEGKVQGLKSHDCHVLLNRLLPIAFRDLLPDNVWTPLTELSESFRALTSTTLRVEDMKKLEESIIVTLCKLEMIFTPSFFDSMEHLPVHLAYEARVGGPVQYRWMYPFERYLGALKRKMSNRARVEASILEAVIIDEIVAFASAYFNPDVETRLNRVGRNYDGGLPDNNGGLSVFSSPGRYLGQRVGQRLLSSKEYDAARIYVLLNCPEAVEYVNIFEVEAGDDILDDQMLMVRTDKEFPSWLRKYISEHPEDVKATKLKPLVTDSYMQVDLYKGYYVNGYVFHTKSYGQTKLTWNSGINLKGNVEYYGVLKEVIELRYDGGNNVVLFNCDWRDSVRGIKKHEVFDLVDVKESSKHMFDDVFILASQAQQVYMTPYPHRQRENSGWWAVWKIKARSTFNIPYQTKKTIESTLDGCYQEDEMPFPPNVSSNVGIMSNDGTHLVGIAEEGEDNNDLPINLPPSTPAGMLALVQDEDEDEDEDDDKYEDEDDDDDDDEDEEDEDEDEIEFCTDDSQSEKD